MLTQNNASPGQTAVNAIPSFQDIAGFVIMFLAVVAIFYMNSISMIKYLAMLAITAIVLTGRKNFIWVLLYFSILDRVGGFFTESTLELGSTGLPLLTLAPGVSIGFADLLLLALVFNLKSRNRFRPINADHILIGCLVLGATLIGTILYGFQYRFIIAFVFRGFFILALFFVIKADFTPEMLIKLLHMISLLLLFVLADQIYSVVAGQRLLERLLNLNLVLAKNTLTSEVRAAPYGSGVVFISFVYGLFLLAVRKGSEYRVATYTYGAFLVVAASLSILISQTRSALGVYAVILLVSAPFLIIRFRNLAITMGIFLLLVNLLGAFGLTWDYFYRNTVARLMTTISPLLAGSEFSELGTGGRDVELPILIEHIKRSPFLGHGMTSQLSEIYNNNIGMVNSIAQFGIIGFTVIILALFNWFITLNRCVKQLPKQTVFYSLGRIIFAALMGMMLGYVTTYNYFTSPAKWDMIKLAIVMTMSSFVFDYYRRFKSLNNP